jgi:hypothetical protein
MRLFRSQRDIDRSTNRLIGRFFATMFIVTIAFAAIVAAISCWVGGEREVLDGTDDHAAVSTPAA